MAKKSGSPISWLVSLISRLLGRSSSSKALPSQQPNEIGNIIFTRNPIVFYISLTLTN